MKLIIKALAIAMMAFMVCFLIAGCNENNSPRETRSLEELRKQYPLPPSINDMSSSMEVTFAARLAGVEAIVYATVVDDISSIKPDKTIYPVDDPMWVEKYPDSGTAVQYYTYTIQTDEIIAGDVASKKLVMVINDVFMKYLITPKNGDRFVYILKAADNSPFGQGFKENVPGWAATNPNIAENGNNLYVGANIFYLINQDTILSAQDAKDMRIYDLMDKSSFTNSIKKLWNETHK